MCRNDDLKQIELLNENELNLSKILFKTGISNSSIWSEFSLWLLCINGASFVLIMSNIESITNIINSVAIRFCFYTLLASSIFGIIARYYYYCINIRLNVFIEIERAMAELQNGMEGIDIEKVLKTILSEQPKFYKNYILKQAEKAKKDILFSYKIITKRMQVRFVSIFFQIIFFIITILIFACNIQLFIK